MTGTRLFIIAICFSILAFAAMRAFGKKRRGLILGLFVFAYIFFAVPWGYRWFYVEKPRRARIEAIRLSVSSMVTSKGGWAALEAECDELIKRASATDTPIGQVFDLPTDLAVLRAINAQRVSIEPTLGGGHFVLLIVSGKRATTGAGIPFYLLIVGSTNMPEVGAGFINTTRPITARVWEAY